MTAVIFPNSKIKSNLPQHNTDSNNSLVNLSVTIRSKVSPNCETENEPTPSVHKNKSQSTMQSSEDLILNTNFDFHAPAFSSQHLQGDTSRGHKRVVTDHVLENGERVVVVDPNISEGEDEDDGIGHDQSIQHSTPPQPQISPLDKAISSLFAAASKSPQPRSHQPTSQRKRSTTPKPKTVSGILAAKRRKVDNPQKRESDADFLNDSLLNSPSASAFLNALTSGPSTSASSSNRKSTNTRPSSSNSDLNTSKSSMSDSGIVSADEHPVIVQPARRVKPMKKTRLSSNDTIPAPVLQLLINAAGGDVNSMNLSELLASDPSLLKSINEAIMANPAQQHTLQIVPTVPVKEEPYFSPKRSMNTKLDQSQYPTADQISAALALWPDLINTASKLDEQTAAKILNACSVDQNELQLNNNEESRVQSDQEEEIEEQDNQELLRLGSEWLLRELFKGKSTEKPQQIQQTQQSIRKRKLESHSQPHSTQIKSSESVLSQLKTIKGANKNQDELEELEQFASHFKRQRIKHGFTQGDIGVALGRRYGTDFSQTTISRFEALNLSFKNMCKLRPLMEEWMNEAEAAIQRGATVSDIVEAEILRPTQEQTSNESMDESPSPTFDPNSPFTANLAGKSTNLERSSVMSSISPNGIHGLNNVLPTLKKRRKRTNLDNQQKDRLDQYFNVNFRPTHEEMQRISDELGLDSDVVRVWFCNRRQKLRKV